MVDEVAAAENRRSYRVTVRSVADASTVDGCVDGEGRARARKGFSDADCYSPVVSYRAIIPFTEGKDHRKDALLYSCKRHSPHPTP